MEGLTTGELMDAAKLILMVFQIILIPAFVWFVKKAGDHQRAVSQLTARVVELEATLENMPGAEAFHQLSLSVERMSGNVKALSERLAGMDRMLSKVDSILDRQEHFLLNGGK